MAGPTTPSEVVQAQLDAYNVRDIDGFMAYWAADAEVFAFPSERLARGAAEIRARHVTRFEEPNLFGALVNRIAVGSLVVDQEVVTRTFSEGPGRVDVVAIYEVENGTIRRAWFKIGTPVLDPASAAAND